MFMAENYCQKGKADFVFLRRGLFPCNVIQVAERLDPFCSNSLLPCFPHLKPQETKAVSQNTGEKKMIKAGTRLMNLEVFTS